MPAAIALGRRLGFVSKPRLFRKSSHSVTYLGGAVVLVSSILGFFFVVGASENIIALMAGGAGMFVLGFIDDRRKPKGLGPGLRLAVEAGIAFAVWRFGLIGVFPSPLEGLVVVVALVAGANALNLLDNMDGVAGSTVLGIGAGVAMVAWQTGQGVAAALALAVAGASLGFLRFNFHRARVYLGDGGALYAGFMLAGAGLQASAPLSASLRPGVVFMLLLVPATDMGVVILSRFMRGSPVSSGGTDHISHRLIRLGASSRWAAAAHGLAAAAAGGAAALAARPDSGLGPVVLVAAPGAFVLAGILLLAVKPRGVAPVRPLRTALTAVACVLGGSVLAAAPAAVSAGVQLEAAKSHFLAGIEAAEKLDTARATEQFSLGAGAARAARRHLDSPLTAPARVLPVAGDSLRAVESMASAAELAAPPAAEALRAADLMRGAPGEPAVSRGGIDTQRWPLIEESLQRAVSGLALAVSRLEADPGAVLPPIATVREALAARAAEATEALARARDGAALAPVLFGAEGPRTWFLVIQNPAEVRGTGGLLGAFGILRAEDGKLSLERLESNVELPEIKTPPPAPAEFMARYGQWAPTRMWQNVNLTPDFPSAAEVMAAMYRSGTGRSVDGVISLDAPAMARLLEVTGPVEDPDAGTVTSENFVRLALNEAYIRFPDKPERVDFLLDLARRVTERFLTMEFGEPRVVIDALSDVAAGKHLQVWIPGEERRLAGLGISGALRQAEGADYVMVVHQNAANNKVDYYVRRDIDYRVDIPAAGPPRGRLQVSFENSIPDPATLPRYITGPYTPDHPDDPPGLNRANTSIYLPRMGGAFQGTLDGRPVLLQSGRERGLSVLSGMIENPAGTRSQLALDVVPALAGQGEYRLVVQRQATLNPDMFRLRVSVPEGAVITGVSDGMRVAGRSAEWAGPLRADTEFVVRYSSSLLDRLRGSRSGERPSLAQR